MTIDFFAMHKAMLVFVLFVTMTKAVTVYLLVGIAAAAQHVIKVLTCVAKVVLEEV